jgi:hypothetical protein
MTVQDVLFRFSYTGAMQHSCTAGGLSVGPWCGCIFTSEATSYPSWPWSTQHSEVR